MPRWWPDGKAKEVGEGYAFASAIIGDINKCDTATADLIMAQMAVRTTPPPTACRGSPC